MKSFCYDFEIKYDFFAHNDIFCTNFLLKIGPNTKKDKEQLSRIPNVFKSILLQKCD